jgi:hypothetical protein
MARVADLKMAIEKAYLSPVEGREKGEAPDGGRGEESRHRRHLPRLAFREGSAEETVRGNTAKRRSGLRVREHGRLPGRHRRAERPRPLQQRPLRRVGKAQEGDGGAGREDPAHLPGPEDPGSGAVPLRPEVQEGPQTEDGERHHQGDREAAGRGAKKALALRHPKAIQKNHIDHVLMLIGQAVRFEEVASNEAADAFDEFEAKLAEAERERKLEEGEGEMDCRGQTALEF